MARGLEAAPVVRRFALNGIEELSIRLDEHDDRLSKAESYMAYMDDLPEEA